MQAQAEAPPSDSAHLLAEFARFIRTEMRAFFVMSAGLSDLSFGTYGNLGALAPINAFLSLCGLPLPPAFQRWEASCTAFAPFLRGHLRFYLEAQSCYVREVVRSLEDRFTAVDGLLKPISKPLPVLTPETVKMAKGLRNLSLQPAEGSPRRRLHWNGRPLFAATTLDEWLRTTHGYQPTIQPGLRVHKVVPNDPNELPFYSVRTIAIEAGNHRGKIVCRGCVRPAAAAALVHYDLSPDHSLSQWLSGYEPLPDQLLPPSDVTITDELAGDWASLSIHDPWRQLIVGHLQNSIIRSYQ